MAQLISITSEALQATIRQLLPSQQGFGEDLQASNVITPVINLTEAAQGSALPEMLQTALSFNDATVFNVNNTNTTIINTPGFWRIKGTIIAHTSTTASVEGKVQIDAGGVKRVLFEAGFRPINTESSNCFPFDFTVFLEPAHGLEVQSTSTICNVIGSVRQIADLYGNLVNPTGFQQQ